MQYNPRNNLKVGGGLLLLVVLIFMGVALKRTNTFRLVESVPRLDNSIATSTGTIALNFNQRLDESFDYNDKLGGQDKEAVRRVRVSGKSLLIDLEILVADRDYSFLLVEVRAMDGRMIRNLPVRFTAIYIPFNQLPDAQKKLEIGQTDRDNADDPLARHLPHQGQQFYLSSEYGYSEEGEPIYIVNAQLFLTKSDLSDRSQRIAEIKKQVTDFIQAQGLDPKTYNIRYTITEAPSSN